ncbi:MAG TPA: DUF4387 domain-containing protein [Bacillota bacterium]
MDDSLMKLAKVIRSKNAGPFALTIDILFKNKPIYDSVKEAELITEQTIASLYDIQPDDVLEFVFFDNANALKITIPRFHPSGSAGERDTYGAQQYVPMLTVPIPDEFLEKVRAHI